jgi:hypothetical protein
MQSSGSRAASSQALKLETTSLKARAQGFKRQATSLKLQDPSAGVQAITPKLRVTGNKHIGIGFMFHVE